MQSAKWRDSKAKGAKKKVNVLYGMDEKFGGEGYDMQAIENNGFIKAVREFVNDNFLFGNNGDLREDTSFLENGIIDSTGILELIAFLEEKYGISVEDEEIVPENFDSLKAIDQYLARKIPSVASRESARG